MPLRRPPCEAQLLVIDGEVEYVWVLPGVMPNMEQCGKPSVCRQSGINPEFDAKFSPKWLCAEHWDLYEARMKEVHNMSPEEKAALEAEANRIAEEMECQDH